jgi:glycosyltransferase involved in cell wall biosynthesis
MIILPGHEAELFCLAAEEARELCVPIVTLGIGSLSERVSHNKTGLVAKNKKEFVDHIIELFKNDKLWLSLRLNLMKLRNSRTWDYCAKELLKKI